MDASYSNLTSTFPWLAQGMKNEPINVPVLINKFVGHKRSYKEIEESPSLEESIQQPPPCKKHHFEEMYSQPGFVSWKVPLCVPRLPSTSPTYLNEFAESIFMPSLLQPNTFSNLHELEFKPEIPEFNNVSDLQMNTNSYIQHLQNVFVKAYEFPNKSTESISIDSLLDDYVTKNIDPSKDTCDPRQNTHLVTNPFIDVTVSNKVVSHSVETFISHLIEDSGFKEGLIVKTNDLKSSHFKYALNIIKERSLSEETTPHQHIPIPEVPMIIFKEESLMPETTRHLLKPILEDPMIIIKEKSLPSDFTNVITRFNSEINPAGTNIPNKSKRRTRKLNFKCEICHKKLQNKYRLKIHMDTHNGMYPHVCAICNKGYERSMSLTSHRRHKHPIPISQL